MLKLCLAATHRSNKRNRIKSKLWVKSRVGKKALRLLIQVIKPYYGPNLKTIYWDLVGPKLNFNVFRAHRKISVGRLMTNSSNNC